jgi:hypothetical protein
MAVLEKDLRAAIVARIGDVESNVLDRNRTKLNPMQLALLLKSTKGEPLRGVIVQYQGISDAEDDDLSLVKRTFRYSIHILLRFNDTATLTETSEDEFTALHQSVADVFTQTQSFGLSGDVQHSYLQEVVEPEVLETEEAGHFHYTECQIEVHNWIEASYC